MELYLVRHGIAEERREGLRDEDRSLTRRGRRRTLQALTGLRNLGVRVDHVLSSPLVRAWETARFVARKIGRDGPRVEAALAPGGSRAALCERLAGYPPDARVALVGHEPDLGRLAGGIPLRKAGVARLDLDGEPRAERFRVAWVLTPAILRSLRRVR